MMTYKDKWIVGIGLLIAFSILIIGSIWAFTRGGNDFHVFYEAWRLVLSGRGLEMYRVSPDRFLYSPGFAILLSPLAWLSKDISLGIWCFLKVLLFFLVSLNLKNHFKNQNRFIIFGISAWSLVFVARPVLIDFEYGQVNFLIMCICLIGLLNHFNQRSKPMTDFIWWSLLTCAAVAKLFPLPLLLVPWLVTEFIPQKKIHTERTAIVSTTMSLFAIPFVVYGPTGFFQLMMDWRNALIARGLPMESHNQSFTALLYHYLSGIPTWIHSEGMNPILIGGRYLTELQINLLSVSWTLITLGILLGWLVSSIAKADSLKWITILLGLLILPSHLVWKPYFVLSIPLAFLLIENVFNKASKFKVIFLALIFFGINFTGFDFVGHKWGAEFEAASIFMWMHLAMLMGAFWI